MFCSISQNSEITEKQNGNKRNSKTKCWISMRFGTNDHIDIVYNLMKSFFGKNVAFLNYGSKYPDWLRPGYHGNQSKNPASLFCAPCSHAPSP